MNIALMNPRINDIPNRPLGLLYIAAVLENEGHKVQVFDPLPEEKEECFHNIRKFDSDIVGITSTTPQISEALRLAKDLKKIDNDVKIIMGGVHPTIAPEEVIVNESVDYVVIGEGERTIVELCEALDFDRPLENTKGICYKKNGKIYFTKPRELIENLDEIPFPARHLLSSDWYIIPPRIRGIWGKTDTLIASRGCPYHCIYCSSHLLFGRMVRHRSVENVIDEIKQIQNDYHVDCLWFADDTFTVNPQWVESFCHALKREALDIKWVCQARVNTVTESLLKLMKSSGCIQLDYGVESGSQKVLNILKKGITVDQTKKAFEITKKVGLHAFASIMIGTPGETLGDIKETEKLLWEVKPDFTEIYFTTPYPGTELYDIVIKKGLIDSSIPYEKWYASKQADKPIIHSELTQAELAKLRNKLHNKIIFRNYWTMLKSKGTLKGVLKIAYQAGRKGVLNGFGRFAETHKIDDIAVEVLKQYRYNTKIEGQYGESK